MTSTVRRLLAALSRRSEVRMGFAALCGLVLFSFIPSSWKDMLHTRGSMHAPGHLIAFCALTLFLLRTTKVWRNRLGVVAGVILLGAGIEQMQAWVNHWFLETRDISLDIGGVFLGVLLMVAWQGSRAAVESLSGRTSPEMPV